MAKQPGRTLLIKIGSGGNSQTFATLCGLTSKTLTINNNEIDVTTADCADPGGPLWTEVMTGAKRFSVSGNGFFEDSAAEARLLSVAQSPSAKCDLQVVVPAVGIFQAEFFLSSYEFGGEQEGGVTYSLSIASSGIVAFAPAAP